MAAARSSSAMAASRVSPASWGTASPAAVPGSPMSAEGVGVDGVAEQVQHRELAALGVGEGVGEPVRQGRGQRPGPAQSRIFPRLQVGFPGAQPVHERLDLAGGGQSSRRAWPVRTVMVSGLPAV